MKLVFLGIAALAVFATTTPASAQHYRAAPVYRQMGTGFRSLPQPVYRTYGQFVARPTIYNAGRAVGYTLFYPQRAY
jgi:hypothetical protein